MDRRRGPPGPGWQRGRLQVRRNRRVHGTRHGIRYAQRACHLFSPGIHRSPMRKNSVAGVNMAKPDRREEKRGQQMSLAHILYRSGTCDWSTGCACHWMLIVQGSLALNSNLCFFLCIFPVVVVVVVSLMASKPSKVSVVAVLLFSS